MAFPQRSHFIRWPPETIREFIRMDLGGQEEAAKEGWEGRMSAEKMLEKSGFTF